MTELTLQLDDDLVLRARAYSARSGKALSELVSGYLASLTNEHSNSSAEPSPAEVGSRRELGESPRFLADRQYELAHQHSGEYVVLVGDRVVHHSPDREAAGNAFVQAFVGHPSHAPVMVDPSRERQPRPKPILRGRVLNRRRPH